MTTPNEAPKPKLTAADLDAIEQCVLKHAAIDHPIAAVSIKDCRDMIAAAREGLEAKQQLAEAQSACEVVRGERDEARTEAKQFSASHEQFCVRFADETQKLGRPPFDDIMGWIRAVVKERDTAKQQRLESLEPIVSNLNNDLCSLRDAVILLAQRIEATPSPRPAPDARPS